MPPQVALATIDPRFTTGVRSVMEFAYETIYEVGCDPYLVYNAYPWKECTTIRGLFGRDWTIPVSKDDHDGMKAVRIGRGLPELLVTNYRLNRAEWQAALSDADAAMVLGGPCLAGVPLARTETPYVVWMGTTIEDEREVQKRHFGIGRRLRYELARPILRRQERLVLLNAERVLVQSTYTKRQVVQRHGLDPDKVEVLPYPVDTEKFSPGEPETNPREVVFVGRLNDPRKNTELLLESFARVVETIPEAHLTLVGDEPDDKYIKLMEELGIRGNVSALGEVESVVPYLRRAAVFAFPSRQEGLGIVGLEAMACGTPVVSTRCGGPEDYVVEDETGYLVPTSDSHKMSDRLKSLIQDPQKRNRLGTTARKKIEREYASTIVEPKLIAAFERLAN